MERAMNIPVDKGLYLIEPQLGERGRKQRMGAILVEAGRLQLKDAQIIVEAQGTTGRPFGESGVQLGILLEDDVRYALAVQYGFAHSRMPSDTVSPSLVAAVEPTHPAVESIKALRTQLVLGWSRRGGCNMLSVVSTQRGEGRSFIAANLAIVFAQMKRKTLLIDMDMRNPALHRWFGFDNASGLSDMLAGHDASPALRQVEFCENLCLLPAGPTPPNPQELLSGEGLQTLMSQAAQEYDVVIADTPTAGIGADAQLIAAQTGSAIIVTRLNHTLTRVTRSLLHRLTGGGVNVLGVVATEH
jgi:protein-tyrosine kinase